MHKSLVCWVTGPAMIVAIAMVVMVCVAPLGVAVAPARLLRARPPMNVSYDHRGFLLDSQPTLWIAGSVHYPRLTPGLWPNAMRLAKDMGMNAITSYVVRTG
eukprot:COSAG02_NODE_42230_length_386_cov_0.951220_1_plen_101_part_01